MSGRSRLYPVSLLLEGKRCVVVGGGQVAARKVQGLLEGGAKVVVVAPKLTARLLALSRRGIIRWVAAEYSPRHLSGASVVVTATGDAAVNSRVAHDARVRGIWANVVDAPELCSFFVPAVVRRGSLCIAISTGGESPLTARLVREQIQKAIGKEYEQLLRLIAAARPDLKGRCASAASRRKGWQRVADSADRILDLLRAGDTTGARRIVEECLSSS